jgi:hypothetical protein
VPDNVTVDNGALADFDAATDEVAVNGGSVAQVQYVKLVDGTGNGTDGLPGTAANGLDVDVTRVIPGTTATALGKAEDAGHTDGDTGVLMLGVRGYTGAGTDGDYSAICVTANGHLCVTPRRDQATIQVTSAGLTNAAYAAGDQLGNQYTIANAARVSGGSGRITSVVLLDEADVVGPVTVLFFDRSVTPAADNAAASFSDADMLFHVGTVELAQVTDLALNRSVSANSISVPYTCNATSLFASVITRTANGAIASATAHKLTVTVERD